MRRFFSIFILLVIAISLTSCMTVNLTADGVDKPAVMNNLGDKKFTVVKHFNRDVKGYFTIFNLITIANPNINEIIKSELVSANGDAVINIRIKGQTTLVDGLVPIAVGIIGTFVAPPYGSFASYLIGLRTYTIEGDIIKYIQ